MADVTINFRARNEASRAIGDLSGQLETLQRLLAEGVTVTIRRGIEAMIAYNRQVVDTREHIASLAEVQETLNDFWRQASGQLPDYASEVERVRTSVIDLTEAERALSAVVASNTDLISVAVAGEREKQSALEVAVSAYERAEVATRAYELANLDVVDAVLASERRIASVGRVINDADPSRAEARLRDFDDAFRLSSVSVPRLTSAMGEFTGTLPDASDNIRDTTRELENLSDAARDAARDAEFLNASIADIEAFDPRVPGRRSRRSGFDTDRFALRQGERVASTAIGLGGDLLRAEERRLASIEDLERQTSERIAAINARKAEALGRIAERIAAEDRRRLAEIQAAFDIAKDAEIAARAEAAAAILEIQADTDRQLQAARVDHLQEIQDLEADFAEDINRIREAFAEREARRQREIVEITERAAADRVAAEERYAQEIVEINRNLVDSVRELRSDLAEQLTEIDAGLEAREVERAGRLVEIEREASDARLAAQERYASRIEDINREVNRNLIQDVERLQERISELQSGLVSDLEALNADFIAREARRSERLGELAEQDAADARARLEERLALEGRYSERVIEINRDLVLRVQDLQAGLVAALADIDSGLLAREAERANALVAIERDVVARREAAQRRYADRIADINRELVRDVREVQADIARIERDAVRARTDVIAEASDARRDAELDYADRVQRIYNDLAGDIARIERDLTNRLDDIRERRFRAEADRVDALSRLERGTIESVEDRRLALGRDIEDIVIENNLRDDITAAELGRIFGREGVLDTDRILGTYDAELIASVERLRREFLRDVEDIERESGRERIEIAEATAREQAELERESAEALSAAEVAREQAESGAGIDAETALANAVPALTEMEQAARSFAETISAIDTEEVSRLQAIDRASAESLASARARIVELETEAGTDFQTALANLVPEVDASTQALNAFTFALETIAADAAGRRAELTAAGIADREATGARRAELIAGTEGQITALETTAGVDFTEALENFVPEADAMTRALNALNDGLAGIETGSTTDTERAEIIAAGVADREAVASEREALRGGTAAAIAELQGQIAALESEAGITFEEALANFVPEIDASTQALQAFQATISEINSALATDRAAVIAAGVADRAGVAGERDALISATAAAIADLEAGAGISFAEALANYVPALDASTQALSDLNNRLSEIDAEETRALGAVATAGALDREATDAAVVERQEVFDADVAEATGDYQTRLIDIEFAAFEEIQNVNTNLKVLLGEIDATLSEALAAIRANKVEFDNAIFAEIREIERESAAELADVRTDASAIRAELETIAQEAKNNAWKEALLSMANVGITIAGVAAGAAIGGPAGAAAGAQIGGVIGGLVEEGGNELFHDPQNDLLAFRSGQQAARGTSRAFSPNAVQRQNAADFSRYFGEGYASEREEIGSVGSERPVVVQLVLNDRVLQEMSVRLSELRGQDRVYGL